MNSKRVAIILFWILICVSCRTHTKSALPNEHISVKGETEVVMDTISVKFSEQYGGEIVDSFNLGNDSLKFMDSESSSFLKDSLLDITSMSELELNKLTSQSKIGRILVFEMGSEIHIASDGFLTYGLFGTNHSPKAIQRFTGNIMNLSHEEIINDNLDEPQIINILTYKESYIKIYFNQYEKRYDIVSGCIANPEIVLYDGIHICMAKAPFFEKLFLHASEYDFSEVNTLNNGNEIGENAQSFKFVGDTLKCIILESNYAWIPFDL